MTEDIIKLMKDGEEDDNTGSPSTSTTDDRETLKTEKSELKRLCSSLNCSPDKFSALDTIKIIENYKGSRVLYSELTNYVFALSDEDLGKFTSNVSTMIEVVENNSNFDTDTLKKVIKIYDHIHLALHQKKNAETILEKSIADAKESISKDVKKMEREYIAILGIFASIVLTFVGGLTFSSSVLQNINAVSIYRLLIVVDILAFALINAIFALVAFIAKISDAGIPLKILKGINIGLGIFAIVVVLLWFFDIVAIQKFFAEFFPW